MFSPLPLTQTSYISQDSSSLPFAIKHSVFVHIQGYDHGSIANVQLLGYLSGM